MWAYALTAPGRLERLDVPDPRAEAPGDVVVRLHAGGICGSDLPSFLGRRNEFIDCSGEPGYPLHEVVGEVLSGDADLAPGTRVVGWPAGHKGLAEVFVAHADQLLALGGELDAVQATVIQPLATVLHALDRLPDVRGKRVAVLGQGPIGLLFTRVLKRRGAAHVTGVDRVDRRETARAFGVDEPVWGDAAAWAAELGDERPELVVEAVGHQTGTLEDAVAALADRGTVLAFGVPDDSHYPFPFRRFFRKHATLLAGATTERRAALAAARDYLRDDPGLLEPYVTDVLPATCAQEAFERALAPAPGRLKVVLDAEA
ncbi:MAG TPA: zinc-binding dehydrogenase [Solirubrobacter sp.]|nr:zinc-binding dehydrogenase [Solirubrobacter sp.]